MRQILDERGLAMLFTQARTQNGWRDETIEDELLKAIYAFAKMGPTSANCSLARFVFIRSREGKQKLRPALSKGNIEKTMTTPATVIVAHDVQFFDMLPRLFPHADARTWFAELAVAAETAMRNGSPQAAYLMLAASA
jgi:3-hydroxypropanoate dehydrogenase